MWTEKHHWLYDLNPYANKEGSTCVLSKDSARNEKNEMVTIKQASVFKSLSTLFIELGQSQWIATSPVDPRACVGASLFAW